MNAEKKEEKEAEEKRNNINQKGKKKKNHVIDILFSPIRPSVPSLLKILPSYLNCFIPQTVFVPILIQNKKNWPRTC